MLIIIVDDQQKRNEIRYLKWLSAVAPRYGIINMKF